MKLSRILSIVVLVLSVVAFMGVSTVFGACAISEDGNIMSCHYAERAIMILSLVMAVTSVVSSVIPAARIRTGLFIAEIITAIAMALTPGLIINMCMMKTMRCWTIMRPFTIGVAIAIVIASVIGIITSLAEGRKKASEK